VSISSTTKKNKRETIVWCGKFFFLVLPPSTRVIPAPCPTAAKRKQNKLKRKRKLKRKLENLGLHQHACCMRPSLHTDLRDQRASSCLLSPCTGGSRRRSRCRPPAPPPVGRLSVLPPPLLHRRLLPSPAVLPAAAAAAATTRVNEMHIGGSLLRPLFVYPRLPPLPPLIPNSSLTSPRVEWNIRIPMV
jgi:hypothetical protein